MPISTNRFELPISKHAWNDYWPTAWASGQGVCDTIV
jgi:hypothetical protein